MDQTYRASLLDQTRRHVTRRRRAAEPIRRYRFALGLIGLLTAVLWWKILTYGPDRYPTAPTREADRQMDTRGSGKPGGIGLTSPPAGTTGAGAAEADSTAAAAGVSQDRQAGAPPSDRTPVLVVSSVCQPASASDSRGLKVGDRLAPGAVIKTGEGGRVTLVTRRGSEICLDTASELVIDSRRAATIRRGRLYCSNRKHEISRIDTPGGRIHLLGTVLNAAVVSNEAVAVTVVEGRVQLTNTLGAATVEAGRRSILAASREPQPGDETDPLDDTGWYHGRRDIQSDFGDIAYTLKRGDGLITEVWVMNSDGSNRRRLKGFIGCTSSQGTWLPNEQRLQIQIHSVLWTTPDVRTQRADAGAGHPIVDARIFLLDAVTGQDRIIKLPAGYDPLYVSVAPDARRIAFSGDYQPNPNNIENREGGVWVYNTRTGGIRKILGGWVKTAPVWAPDSRRIAMSKGEGYGIHHPLVIVDADTGKVTDLGINGAGASFSPDGKKLAYCSGFEGGGAWVMGVPPGGSIYVKDLTSDARAVRISPQGEGALTPRWSPDGTRISYCVSHYGPNPDYPFDNMTFSIFVARADGTDAKEIYKGKGNRPPVEWARSADAVYAISRDAVLLIAADGSGVQHTMPTDEKHSPLTRAQRAQTDASVRTVREAIYHYALANVKQFEGNPAEKRRCLETSEELFAGLVWNHPLADPSLADSLAYADKAVAEAAKGDATILSESCAERMSYADILLGHYVEARKQMPETLEDLEKRALSTSWGINWLFAQDKRRARMIFECPGTPNKGPARYRFRGSKARPEKGNAIITCPNHPANHVTLDEKMSRATHFPWAITDDPRQIMRLIKRGEDVNAADEGGRTALHFAVLNDYYGAVKLLLEKGAKVNVKEHSKEGGFHGWGWYPLHLALRNENKAIIRLLIDHGADVNAPRSDGWTPMLTAAYHGQPDMIALLLSKGADVNYRNSEPLRIAIRQGMIEAARIMLERGAKVDGADGDDGQSALAIAARQGDIAAVKLLIENGAEIDLKDKASKTPLFHAASMGYADIVEALLSRGADANAGAKADRSILQAVRNGEKSHLESGDRERDKARHDWRAVREALLRHGAKE